MNSCLRVILSFCVFFLQVYVPQNIALASETTTAKFFVGVTDSGGLKQISVQNIPTDFFNQMKQTPGTYFTVKIDGKEQYLTYNGEYKGRLIATPHVDGKTEIDFRIEDAIDDLDKSGRSLADSNIEAPDEGFGFGEALGVVSTGMNIAGQLGVGASLGKGLADGLRELDQAHFDAQNKWINDVKDKIDLIRENSSFINSASSARMADSLSNINHTAFYGDGLDEKYFGPASDFPHAGVNYQLPANSLIGGFIEETHNEYLDFWAETQGLNGLAYQQKLTYLMGLGNLSQAAGSLAAGLKDQALGYLKGADLFLEISKGVFDGVSEAVVGIAENYKHLAEMSIDILSNLDNPEALGKSFVNFLTDIPDIAGEIEKEIFENLDTLKNGTAYERSKLISRTLTNAAADYFSGGSNRALKVSRMAKRTKNIKSALGRNMKSSPAKFKHSVNSHTEKYLDKYKHLNKAGEAYVKAIPDIEFIGNGQWKSKAGLVYGPDPQFVNRFNHVLAHQEIDPTKKIHSVFTEKSPNRLAQMLDDYYPEAIKNPPIKSSGTREVFKISTGNLVVGTNNEKNLIYVLEDRKNVITVFPSK